MDAPVGIPVRDNAGRFDRVLAVIRALAAGEAMGRATEHYHPEEIEEIYEDAVVEFLEPVRLFDAEEWLAAETGELMAALIGAGPDVPFVRGIRAALGRSPGTTLPPVEAALAAALSTALAGSPLFELPASAAAAARGAGDSSLAEQIILAAGTAQASGGRRPGQALRGLFPPDGAPEMLLAFAIGLAYAAPNARRAILEAVNQGGHSPETAALAGALAAALAPTSVPRTWTADIERVNGFDLDQAARQLLLG